MADNVYPEQPTAPVTTATAATPPPATTPTPELTATTPPAAAPAPTPSTTPVTPSPTAVGQRPGMVTFVAMMMFLLAGFQVTIAIEEFARASWLVANIPETAVGAVWVWGLLDLAFGLAALYAGYDLLRGGTFGQIFALVVAGVSAIRWFFYLPVTPLVALIVIAVDILIIYGLCANSDYFRASHATGTSRRPVTI